MANDNKAVGPLASARLVTLIKAETGKKYDKTGGKIEGSAEITGGLKVGMSSEFSSSIKAESEISSDMLLMAPIVALYDPAKEESISFGVSGENAAKVTSPVSGGGVQYARLAVGTPTGDNDAATKAYVDSKSAVAVDDVMSDTSTNPVQNKTIKQYVDDHAVYLPLTLTYANRQATGASYSDIRKAIESGRQIKLSVANTPDIIASNARNETNKSVLMFTNTDVGGDTVNISQYTVTAQASGLTCNVKSHELA